LAASDFAQRYGPWALITGASTEIGAEFADQLAERGINLVLIARRRARVKELACRLESMYGVQVVRISADLAQPDFMSALEPATQSLDIGLLISNAEFATAGSFLAHDIECEVAQLHVNCRAPLILAHVYGNRLARRGKGGIIFASSVSGYVANSFETNYAANKIYELFLTEALRYELAALGIDVLALCPGIADSEFQVISGNQTVGQMPVRPVVEIALDQLDRKSAALANWHNRLLFGLLQCAPRRLQTMVAGKFTGWRASS
jgi:short-subunit dehydrogenase